MGTYLINGEYKELSAQEFANELMPPILIPKTNPFGPGKFLAMQDGSPLTEDEWTTLKNQVDSFFAGDGYDQVQEYRAYRAEQKRQKELESARADKSPVQRKTKIYVMLDTSTGYYKIGRSINPSFREKTLQSKKPTITLLFGFDSTHQQEKQLHAQYAEKRVRGEWFALTEDDLSTIKEQYL